MLYAYVCLPIASVVSTRIDINDFARYNIVYIYEMPAEIVFPTTTNPFLHRKPAAGQHSHLLFWDLMSFVIITQHCHLASAATGSLLIIWWSLKPNPSNSSELENLSTQSEDDRNDELCTNEMNPPELAQQAPQPNRTNKHSICRYKMSEQSVSLIWINIGTICRAPTAILFHPFRGLFVRNTKLSSISIYK